MDVVWHQAVRPDLDAATVASLGHPFKILQVFVIAEESRLPPMAPLRHVMRIPRDDDACDSWHDSIQ